jgi:hypothetical protein
MFTAQWADYIAESPERMADLKLWKQQGHEIAAHHHSIYHPGIWDGYTNYTKEQAIATRIKLGHKPEHYLGTLEDFMEKVKLLNANINSGCVNEEVDKKAMPDEIIYSTCSGYYNFGEPGSPSETEDLALAKNDYITVGIVDGIERKWLTHGQIYRDEKGAEDVFNSMSSGVYGAVIHSNPTQAQTLKEFMDFLHSKDPTGQYSRTVSEIIESNLLPEEEISINE